MIPIVARLRRHRRRGVYLVEVLMAGVLGAMVVYGLCELYMVGQRLTKRVQAEATAWQAANLGMEKIARLTRDGMTLSVTGDGTGLTVVLPADKDAAGNYIPRWQGSSLKYLQGDQVAFYKRAADGVSVGNILCLWRKPASASWAYDREWSLQPNSTVGQVQPVSGLTFYQQAGWSNEVTVTLTVTQPYGNGQASVTLVRTIYLRNHN